MLRSPLPLLAPFVAAGVASNAPTLAHDDFVPTATQLAGWPIDLLEGGGEVAEVVDLAGLRFCDELETDFMVLLDDGQLFLGYRPERYETFFPLGVEVEAMAVVARPNETDAVLVVDDSGLALRSWAPSQQSVYVDTPLAPAWTKVTRLWTHESAQGITIYGLDPEGQRMKRVLLNGVTVEILSDLLAPAGLVDFVPLEYDEEQDGIELAWLYEDALSVTSEDQLTMISNLPAAAGDVIARIPAAGGGEDLLAWCSDWEGQRWFVAWSQHASGVPHEFQGATPTRIVVYDRNGDGLADVALPRAEDSKVELLEHIGWGSFAPPEGKRWLDTNAPESSLPAVSQACATDVDLDGDLDLLVSHLGTPSLHFQLSDVVEEDMLRLRLDRRDEITRSFEGEDVILHLPMSENTYLGDSFHALVWVERTEGANIIRDVSYQETLTFGNGGPNALQFDLRFSQDGINHEVTNVTYWIYVTAVETATDGDDTAIVKRLPTRLISWQPHTGASPEGASALPVWRYVARTGGDDITGKRRGNKLRNNGSGGPPP